MSSKIILLISFAFLAITITGCNSIQATPQPAGSPAKVLIKKIIPVEMPESLSCSGTIEPDNTVSLGFSNPGRVCAVSVMEGQHVGAGQLLASIETEEYGNALLLAQAGLDQALDNFTRLNELHAKGSLPDKDFVSAKILLAQAEVTRNIALKKIRDTKLYAPFAGIVSGKLAEKGAIVAPGQPAFTLLKTDFVYAQAAVTEANIARISVGNEAVISVPSLGKDARSKINIINPQADPTTRTFNIKIRLPNPGGKLLPGMIAEMKIATGRTATFISVPPGAILRDADDICYVFVLNDQNKAIRKRVATGGLSATEVIITNGLKRGDNLIITGQKRLRDGQAVAL